MNKHFKVIDVFTDVPFKGNPVAVVFDADGLSGDQMQGIANWTNLSETTFVMRPTSPEADYKVRIFSPTVELPFAGHPTIGVAHAVLETGICSARNGQLVQECGVGLVKLKVNETDPIGRSIFFDLPAAAFNTLGDQDFEAVTDILGIPRSSILHAEWVSVGPSFIVVQLPTADQTLQLQPKLDMLWEFSKAMGIVGFVVFGLHTDRPDATIESRAFFPILGINEDPVCGSGNGAIAAFIHKTGQTETFGRSYVSTQGVMVGRAGRISVNIGTDGAVQIGGQSMTCLDGTINT
ncbi:PhzF family phenazine biosynthesis protein [Xylophilus sp. GW821-FHT01B05]